MNRQGFTLIELIVVMAIMATLLSIGALEFSKWSRKNSREAQVRELMADVTTAQINALQQKRRHRLEISSGSYAIRRYASAADTTGTVILQKNVNAPLTVQGAPSWIEFDTLGASNVGGTPRAICLQDNSQENMVDAIVVGRSKINLAKRNAGEACQSDKCILK